MKHLRLLLGGISLLAGLIGAARAQSDEQALLIKGEYLSRIGDCMACHSVPGRPAYSGGLPIDSSVGTIYSTNITPDKQHGIGNYSETDFANAVRQGVLPDGTHLYPAMPYPAYAKISDEDIRALYTYFMKGVSPSAMQAPSTSLSFPFNQRWGMALWNMIFTSDAPFQPAPGWSPQVLRGAYLVESLGHCGSCHTARGFAMNEKGLSSADASFLAGGDLNGWLAPSLRGMKWTTQDIVDYLSTGRNRFASVGGEMTSVVANSTSHLTDDDLASIAAYLKTLSPAPTAARSASPKGSDATIAKLTSAKDLTLGERLYLDNCAACHFVNGKGAPRVFPQLDGASLVNAENPTGLIHTILAGAQTPSTDRAPSILPMPGFARRLSNSEVAELATFLRGAWNNQAPAVTTEDVADVRENLPKSGP